MVHADITGQKFGRLLAIEYVGVNSAGNKAWKCLCECGKTSIVTASQLVLGRTKSCGCYKNELSRKRLFKHGQSCGRGKKGTRLHGIWVGVKGRCHNPHTKDYPYYGGRGINICDEWNQDFISFEKWALANGYADDLTLDRIDNGKDYCPENCRWVDRKTQMRNTRNSHYVTYNGNTKTITEWSEVYGVSRHELNRKINAGWDFEKAIKSLKKAT